MQTQITVICVDARHLSARNVDVDAVRERVDAASHPTSPPLQAHDAKAKARPDERGKISD